MNNLKSIFFMVTFGSLSFSSFASLDVDCKVGNWTSVGTTLIEASRNPKKFGLDKDEISLAKKVYKAATWGQSYAIKYLLGNVQNARAAKVLSLYQNGETPLIAAARTGNKKTVAQLLKKFADPNQVDRINCQTPLIHAAKGGHKNTIEYLIIYSNSCPPGRNARCVNKAKPGFPWMPISLNHVDKLGRNALHYAAENKHKKTVVPLVERYGVQNTKDKTGMSPSVLAKEKGHRRIAEIIEAGVDMYRKNWQMGWTMARTGKGILKRFIAHRKDADTHYLGRLVDDLKKMNMINVPDDNGKVALMYAAEYGQKEIVKKLLSYGARKAFKCKDCYGEEVNWTASDYAKNRATLIYNYGTKIEVREANEIISILGGRKVNSATAAPAPKPIDKSKASKVLKMWGK
jgi:ankyrin repeat protein